MFVRNVAPRDPPVGPDLIRQSIRQAYARAGLPYTRSHRLRHTLASRLLAGGGSSLKEVADDSIFGRIGQRLALHIDSEQEIWPPPIIWVQLSQDCVEPLTRRCSV